MALILAIVGLAACGKPANTSLPATGPAGDASQSDATPGSSIHQEETQIHGKYDDVKEAYNKFIDANTHFTAQLETESNAAELSKALNEYSTATEEFIVAFKSIEAKHPELSSQNNPPPELEETMNNFNSVLSNLAEIGIASGSAEAKYPDNPMVIQASQRQQAAWHDLGNL